MEKKNSFLRAGFSTILWGVLAILLCAVPSVAAWINIDPSNSPYDLETVQADYINVLSGGTLNLKPGGYATLGVYANAGSTINIYGCDLTLGDTGVPVQVAGSVDVMLLTNSTKSVQFTTTGGSAQFDDPDNPTMIIVHVTSGWTGKLTWTYEGTTYSLNISTLSDIKLVNLGGGGPQPVEIDIKPGSDPNPINPGSNGLIPVAILTTDDFNAADVDPATVTLAGEKVAVRGKAEKLMARLEDVDGDGDLDLLVQVETQSDGEPWESGTVTLEGKTYDGQDIKGTDEVIIVPPVE